MADKPHKSYLAYEYGCGNAIRGVEQAIDQMRRRNQLWNRLVEIDRAHRVKSGAIINATDAGVDVKELIAKRDGLREQIRARRKLARKAVDIKDLKLELTRIREALCEAIPKAMEARKAKIAAERAILDSLDLERRALVKAASTSYGLYWCNYDDVLASYEVARVRAMKEGRDLQFHSFRGEGKVSVRFQIGMAAEDVFRNDTRLQIDPVDPALAWNTVRAIRRKNCFSRLRLRVGSEQNRRPMWLELPIYLHRPLAEGRIRQACVVRQRVGNIYRWKVILSLEVAAQAPRVGPAIGIDIGWRLMADGLRIAYWADENGEHGEIKLTSSILSQFAKLRDLRQILDGHFEQAKILLGAWSKAHADLLPPWMDLSSLAQWRNHRRFVWLQRQWVGNRFARDERGFEMVAQFCERYNHLYPWEANLRDQLLRCRRELYRCAVAKLLATHGNVYIESFDLRRIASIPAEELDRSTGRSRSLAAPSSLLNLFRIKGQCSEVPAPNTTQDCSWCGHQGKWDASPDVLHRCGGCGELWDQDYNAARNILQRGLSQIGSGNGQKDDPRKIEEKLQHAAQAVGD